MNCQKALLPALLLPLCWSASRLPAHPTPDMDAVRLGVNRWALGLLRRDIDSISDILADEMTSSAGRDKQAHVEELQSFISRQTTGEVLLHHALYNQVGEQILVTPIFLSFYQRTVRKAVGLTFGRRGEKWKIVRVSWLKADQVQWPKEWEEIDLPEQQPLVSVPVRVKDSSTGEPVASRVRVTDAADQYWPPAGHQKNVAVGWRQDVGGDVVVGGNTYAYVEPEFQIQVPAGEYKIEVVRGLEYLPRTLEFQVRPGEIPALDLGLKRWANMAGRGWYSGDTHVHFLGPHSAWLEARGEDLNVVNVLAAKWGELITSVEHFQGRPDPLSGGNHIVYVNEESRHNFLGHTVLLNLKELVYPLSWEGPGAGIPGGIDSPSMAHHADQAHAQGGLVGWAHFPNPDGELAVDVALGKIDSFDLFTWGDPFSGKGSQESPLELWYRFLNCGFDIPLTAGTDKMWNRQVVGNPRTYVKVEGPFSYAAWIAGIRAGRTFVTTGPLLDFQMEGRLPGETIAMPEGGELEVKVNVRSRIPVARIEIIQNGKVVSAVQNDHAELALELASSVRIDKSSWIAARVYSPRVLPYQAVFDPNPVMAHTGPVYVRVSDQPRRSAGDAAFFEKWTERAIRWLETEAHIPDRSEFEKMHDLFDQARSMLLELPCAKSVPSRLRSRRLSTFSERTTSPDCPSHQAPSAGDRSLRKVPSWSSRKACRS